MHFPPRTNANILIIDDEVRIAQSLAEHLQPHFHKVFYAFSYETGLEKALSEVPDILCVDVNLRSEKTGLDLCREVRKHKPHLPMLIITGSVYPFILQETFSLGLSDYVTKPYHPDEVALRLHNLLSVQKQIKPTEMKQESFQIAEDFTIDYRTSTLSVDGEQKHLTKTLRYLLQLFLENKNEILSHQFLHEKLWGDYYEIEKKREIRSHTKRLRTLLGEKYGAHLINVKSQGYMLKL